MANTSPARRSSVVNFGLPWYTTLPSADAEIDRFDRSHMAHQYAGRFAIIGGYILLPSDDPLIVRRQIMLLNKYLADIDTRLGNLEA